MNGYNFTNGVRRVLQMAREEAMRLRHEYVGTEHILLGLMRENDGVPAAVLKTFNVDPGDLVKAVEVALKPGQTDQAAGPDLPYTSRAKKVLECSMSEARELSHSYVGSEHLLLGLLREEKGIAAQVLTQAGVRLELARAEVVRRIGRGVGAADGARPQIRTRAPAGSGWGVTIRGSTILLGAGIMCAASGIEALRYAPNPFEKAVGVLGALSGGLMLLASRSLRRFFR